MESSTVRWGQREMHMAMSRYICSDRFITCHTYVHTYMLILYIYIYIYNMSRCICSDHSYG
jgi:hypothetical protein